MITDYTIGPLLTTSSLDYLKRERVVDSSVLEWRRGGVREKYTLRERCGCCLFGRMHDDSRYELCEIRSIINVMHTFHLSKEEE